VSIYADDPDEIKFGALNCYTKWPTFFDASLYFRDANFDIWGASSPPTLKDRNYFYKNWRTDFPVNGKEFWEEFDYNVRSNLAWYNSRNKLQPWEVNETEYTVYTTPPSDRVLHFGLANILKDTFLIDTYIPWVESQNIGQFNWDHAINYHSTYVNAQKNAEWFTAVDNFRKSKNVNKFLLSNSLTQAFLLEELGSKLEQLAGWNVMSTEKILKHFDYSVDHI